MVQSAIPVELRISTKSSKRSIVNQQSDTGARARAQNWVIFSYFPLIVLVSKHLKLSKAMVVQNITVCASYGKEWRELCWIIIHSQPMRIHPLMDWENTKPKSCIFGIHECVDGFVWEKHAGQDLPGAIHFGFTLGVNGQMGRLDYSTRTSD